jgi:3-oxoacid CoA-transferase subunit A
MINKLVDTAEAAISDVSDGASILIGGFGPIGCPFTLNLALLEKGVKDLTLIGTSITIGDHLDQLVKNKCVKKIIAGYPFQVEPLVMGQPMPVSILRSEYLRGEIEIEMVPFGTLLERIRSGGCGIPAFYLPIGIGTTTEEGKEKRVFNDKQYLLETAIKADFAFVHARKGDRLGNLTYRLAARAANPIVATAAKTVIAEVDEIVEPGEIDPDIVHTPGIYITRVIKSTKYEILFK